MSNQEKFVVAAGLEEGGVLAGNLYDKYGSRNPVARYLMRGFEESLEELVTMTSARTIHEVGCGEGYWTIKWAAQGISARGSDFSEQVLSVARSNAERQRADVPFRVASLYDLKAPDDEAELVVCCEVLEHLPDPPRALDVLAALASPWLIVSVPREPVWSLMNLGRGKYWSRLGNTPGHIQQWTTAGFMRLVTSRFDVEAVRMPVPWTMALCRRRT